MPPVLEQELDAVVRAGLFSSREEALATAVGLLFDARPGMRLEAAIEMFKSDEISLTRGAEIAGLDFITFQQILSERGVPIIIECDTPENMDADAARFFGE